MNDIDNMLKGFKLSQKELKDLSRTFTLDMEKGLKGKQSSLSMISSYTDTADMKKQGKFMAFDLGGSNFRVMVVELLGKGRTKEIFSYKKTIPKKCMKAGQHELFGFMANTIKMAVQKGKIKKSETVNAGFTFSFPVKQKNINEGYLLKWTKGFAVKGVKGHNIVELMNSALAKKGMANITVNALVNDTVGTQVNQSYRDENVSMGIILGTGNNACYREHVKNIAKENRKNYGKEHMIINIEWGQFPEIPRTKYDKQLDKLTPNPGDQYLEKMVSGMYLGEICRLVMVELIKKGKLLDTKDRVLFEKEGTIASAKVSDIEKDRTKDLKRAKDILKKNGVSDQTIQDRKTIQKIAQLISNRAGNIVAMGIASVIRKIDPKIKNRHTVAIDGSVYEKYHDFPKKIKIGLKSLLGVKRKNIKLVLSKDGSGKGAAIISSCV